MVLIKDYETAVLSLLYVTTDRFRTLYPVDLHHANWVAIAVESHVTTNADKGHGLHTLIDSSGDLFIVVCKVLQSSGPW